LVVSWHQAKLLKTQDHMKTAHTHKGQHAAAPSKQSGEGDWQNYMSPAAVLAAVAAKNAGMPPIIPAQQPAPGNPLLHQEPQRSIRPPLRCPY
jgi:hypothetical protein